MPGSDGQDDGVDPEQQHEDDDDDLRGGENWLWDPPLIQGREHCGLVGLQHLHLTTRNLCVFVCNTEQQHLKLGA